MTVVDTIHELEDSTPVPWPNTFHPANYTGKDVSRKSLNLRCRGRHGNKEHSPRGTNVSIPPFTSLLATDPLSVEVGSARQTSKRRHQKSKRGDSADMVAAWPRHSERLSYLAAFRPATRKLIGTSVRPLDRLQGPLDLLGHEWGSRPCRNLARRKCFSGSPTNWAYACRQDHV